jgi:hypothetical protein
MNGRRSGSSRTPGSSPPPRAPRPAGPEHSDDAVGIDLLADQHDANQDDRVQVLADSCTVPKLDAMPATCRFTLQQAPE